MPPAIKVGLVVLCVVVMITALALLFAGLVFVLQLAEFKRADHMTVLSRVQERERDA